MGKYAIYKTELGCFKISYDNQYITAISYMQSCTSLGEPTALTDSAASQLQLYFEGELYKFDLPLKIKGTEFQQKVWKALMDIPYGQTRSYKDIAQMIGQPNAARAIGMANNKNPLLIIIPCHRVIGTSGSLTGYAAGLDLKINLLKIEKENSGKSL